MKRQTSPGTWGNVCIKWRKKVTAKPSILECAKRTLFCLLLVFLIKSMVCGWVGGCVFLLFKRVHTFNATAEKSPKQPRKKNRKPSTIMQSHVCNVERSGNCFLLCNSHSHSLEFAGLRNVGAQTTHRVVYQQVCPLVARS